MSELDTQILETWRIHHRTMLLTISSIPEEAFRATLSKRGGRDIARQLAHACNVRISRLTAFGKRKGIRLAEFDPAAHPSKKVLLDAFTLTGSVMEDFVAECLARGGEAPNFRRGVVPMIGYYISHEAHHRGHLLLTMKQLGFRIPDALKWGVWEWNKI